MANLRANKIVSTTGSNAITGSVEFDGTGDYLTAGTSNDYIFGTGDYTLECWAYFSTLNSENSLVSTHNGDANWTWKVVSNKLRIYTGTVDVDGTSTITTGSWFHFAVSRQSSTLRLFVNGINETTTTSTNDYTINNILHIGAQQNNLAGTYLKGFISNLRIVKGTALYTDNFIPPTAELKNIPGTVLLCCQDPKSATQEATGKTITVNGNATARNFTPAVGSDGSIEFVGPTKISTENYFYLPTGNTEDRGRGRGLIVGGSNTNSIEYITIASQGNGVDFGDLSAETSYVAALANSTRGIFAVSRTPSTPNGGNTIEYATISSTGNSLDFGDSTVSVYEVGTASNNTRGIIAGGYTGPGSGTPANSVVIDYVTIASIGDAITFGDLTYGRRGLGGFSSPVRACFAAGYQQPDTATETNIIDYVTIASTGNAQDFGDLTAARWGVSTMASSTRGVYAGGLEPASLNVIDYVTIVSTGNAIDFGDLTTASGRGAGVSNSIRGVTGLGGANTMDYITIATTGDAKDFGDMITAIGGVRGGCSDSHGGLG